jgi:hypothetical protein
MFAYLAREVLVFEVLDILVSVDPREITVLPTKRIYTPCIPTKITPRILDDAIINV